MYKKYIYVKVYFIKAYLLCLLFIGFTDYAFSNDIKQNDIEHYVFKSNMSIIDSHSNMIWFLGNSTLNTNTIKITADSIGVDQKDGVIQKIISNGNPATFSR